MVTNEIKTLKAFNETKFKNLSTELSKQNAEIKTSNVEIKAEIKSVNDQIAQIMECYRHQHFRGTEFRQSFGGRKTSPKT